MLETTYNQAQALPTCLVHVTKYNGMVIQMSCTDKVHWTNIDSPNAELAVLVG